LLGSGEDSLGASNALLRDLSHPSIGRFREELKGKKNPQQQKVANGS